MLNGARWFSTELEEQTLLDQRTKSSHRQKRLVHCLDSSSSDNEIMGDESETSQQGSMNLVLAELRKINENLTVMNDSINEVKGEIHSLKDENDRRKNEIEELRNENEYLHTKITQLENRVSIALEQSSHNAQYSRRNNIRMYGIKEAKGENVIASVTSIIINNLGLKDFRPQEIDVAHRLGPYDNSPVDPKPRAIIVRFVRRVVRDQVIKNRKKLAGSRMSIQDDLTKQNMQLLNKVKQHSIVNSAWAQDGRIMISVKDSGKITQVNSLSHLEENRIAWINWVKPKPKTLVSEADDKNKPTERDGQSPNQPTPEKQDKEGENDMEEG